LGDWCVEDYERRLTTEVTEETQRKIDDAGAGETRYSTQHPTPDVFIWQGRRYRPNDLFRARVLGEFPGCAENALIPLRWVESARDRELPASGAKRLAVDVARFGDDETVIGLRIGPVLVRLEAIKGTPTTETTGRIVQLAYAERPETIAVDEA